MSQLTIRLVESYLHCNSCGKQVSTGFFPVETDTPDKGIIIRAWIECPECIEDKTKTKRVKPLSEVKQDWKDRYGDKDDI